MMRRTEISACQLFGLYSSFWAAIEVSIIYIWAYHNELYEFRRLIFIAYQHKTYLIANIYKLWIINERSFKLSNILVMASTFASFVGQYLLSYSTFDELCNKTYITSRVHLIRCIIIVWWLYLFNFWNGFIIQFFFNDNSGMRDVSESILVMAPKWTTFSSWHDLEQLALIRFALDWVTSWSRHQNMFCLNFINSIPFIVQRPVSSNFHSLLWWQIQEKYQKR